MVTTMPVLFYEGESCQASSCDDAGPYFDSDHNVPLFNVHIFDFFSTLFLSKLQFAVFADCSTIDLWQ
jgi:hypothetical protein